MSRRMRAAVISSSARVSMAALARFSLSSFTRLALPEALVDFAVYCSIEGFLEFVHHYAFEMLPADGLA